MDDLKRQLKQLIVDELDIRSKRAEDILDAAPLFGHGSNPAPGGPPSLGLDSLDALQLAMSVEERFGVRIPEGEEARGIFASIDSLAAYIEQARPGSKSGS
jgi:acyl carrier protein